MSNASDFIIENGVLTKYVGPGGDVTIPEGVTSIGERAFEWCRQLTSIMMPDSVMSIGDRAFSGCGNLTHITLPDGMVSIGNGAFSGCESLTSITIPDSVTSLASAAFQGCKGLANAEGFVILGGTLYGYYGTSEKVIIPDNVTRIGYRAFSGCSNLKKMVVSSKVFAASEMVGKMFGDSGKTIELLILREGQDPLRTIGAFRKTYWTQEWNYQEDFLISFTEADLHAHFIFLPHKNASKKRF